MAPLNKAALGLFASAKLSGMIGVCLGFGEGIYHTLGGAFLTVAFIFIFSAVACSMVQASRDKKKFSIEDLSEAKTKRLARMKAELEQEIQTLEDRRSMLQGLMVRRG